MVKYSHTVKGGAKMEHSCCFTGYRPEKFPFELRLGTPEFNTLENKIYDAVFAQPSNGITTFYCGMAMGFDLLAGKAVVDLKRTAPDRNIRLVAVVPYRGQPAGFTPNWQKLYDIVLNEADETVILSEEYHISCFAKRNRYMVDRSRTVLCYFDGQSGGTANTVKYAASKGRRIINLAEYDLTDSCPGYPVYQLELDQK